MGVYDQAILAGASMAPAIRKQREASNFNLGNALIPAIIAAIAAPFTGGASLAGVAGAFGEGALKGTALEATRATTAQQEPMARQLAMGATQQGLERAFPTQEKLLNRQFADAIASGDQEKIKSTMKLAYPEIFAKSLFPQAKQPSILELLILQAYPQLRNQMGIGGLNLNEDWEEVE